METLFKDIRYGVRGLLKRPGFTVIALVTLALGIGANTAIFSVVNAVLLRPLQFRDPEQLVVVWEDATFAGFPRNTPAPANYLDWKTQNQSFSDVAAAASNSFNLTGDGEPERVQANSVSANFFPLFGVPPLLGRGFLTEEDKPGANKVVVLSYDLWQGRYGGDRSLINREVLLNGEKHTVVGVMPRGFQFLEKDARLWVPLALDQEELANRRGHYLQVVARLKPAVPFSQAQADMNAVMRRIAVDHPGETFGGKLGAIVMPLRDQVVGAARGSLIVLLVAVAFVLLIACANVAGLLLARAVARRREIALRMALGAGRVRMVRQLLTESLLLATVAGVLGSVLAYGSFTFLQGLIPEQMALGASLKLDTRILIFTLAISIVTGIIFGLVPALQAAKFDLNDALKQGSTRATASGRLRGTLIVFEIALSIVLLVGAGLLIQTLFQLFRQYSVLEPEKVLTMRTILPLEKYREPQQRDNFYQQVLQRVEHLPGVVSAGYSTSVPLSWKGGTSGFYPEGLKSPIPGMAYDANHRQVSAGYLRAMNIPLRQGRYFDNRDNSQSMSVAIINETMARQYWPGENALGRRLKVGDPGDSTLPWTEIVGIVADVRQMGLDEPVKAEMYLPYQQINHNPWFIPRDLAIRTNGDTSSLVGSVRQIIGEVDPDQPISNVATMAEVLGTEAAQRRMGMILLAGFALLALLLASLGIYGVLAYFVTQHTNEIGVRQALGATPRNILFMVLKKGMGLTLIGVAIGLASAFALTRLMSSLLFGVKASDPLTFVTVPLLLALVALLACYIPARRATKVDPLVALRYE
ncbi:MAG TPA: ABC transporter permease [Pyrinomonadaceae bacterium]|jgi:putative ABC transport system permease protein|nr:ABC transporter permease [Pyrinomonadaceae bacterium]